MAKADHVDGVRVRRLRLAKGWTQKALATFVEKAGGKLSQGQLSAIEKGGVERPGALVELAAVLDTTEEYLLGKSDANTPIFAAELDDSPFAPPSEAVLAPDAPLPPYRAEMPKDVPVYGTVVGGDGQDTFDFELNGTVVDRVRRPPRIAGRSDVFAVYVSGGSMAPWREPGQLIYVEVVKSPKALDYVLIEFRPRDGQGVRPALVKRLLSITPTKLRVRQFDPPKDFDIERRAVLRILRVMDWDELMGV